MSVDPKDPRLTAFVLGELSEKERMAVESEIAASAELQRTEKEIRRAVELLSRHLESEACPHLTTQQHELLAGQSQSSSLSQQNAAHPRGLRRQAFWRSRRFVACGIVAATLLVCGTLVWYQLDPRFGTLAKRGDRTGEVFASVDSSSTSAHFADSGRVAAGHSWTAGLTDVDNPSVRLEGATRDNSEVETLAIDVTRPTAPDPYSLSGITKEEPQQSASVMSGQVVNGPEWGLPAPMSGSDNGVAFSPDGSTLQSVDLTHRESGVDLWDAGKTDGAVGAPATTFVDKSAPAQAGTSLSAGDAPLNHIATTSRDGAVRAWHNAVRSRRRVDQQQRGTDASPWEGNPLGDREVRPGEGTGAGWGGDKYDAIVDNPFREVKNHELSTFSIDVDTASYSKVRMYLAEHRTLPPPSAVRIEELVNYFNYDYEGPNDDRPFAAHVEVAVCPWEPEHRLARVGIKGKEIDRSERPASNLVFLMDVSGSMKQPNKLPLLKRGMKRLVGELGENDQVSIVVYAGAAGLVLPSTTGDQKPVILDTLERLQAGGSTNGGEGIRLAYQIALDNYIKGGTNRVILCTDGDFNVGTTSTGDLVDLVTESAKDGVFISVLGFGMGNHNDAMLENISNKGNGNYAFIDTDTEAKKVLVEQMSGTLVTIAKDVKIQIEFNPAEVSAYRLIGYENRILAAEDFNDDKKDAGEIGAGHTATALYEIVPADTESDVQIPPVDELKYQKRSQLTDAASSDELLTLKIRHKEPDGDVSMLLSFPVKDEGQLFGQATGDFKFAAAVASFGMILRDSPHKGDTNFDAVLEIAAEAAGDDANGYRHEFLEMVQRAKEITGQ